MLPSHATQDVGWHGTGHHPATHSETIQPPRSAAGSLAEIGGTRAGLELQWGRHHLRWGSLGIEETGGLFAPGSDRAAEKWKDDYTIEGVADLELHHLYRAMAWLGEVLAEDRQDGATPFSPRTNKDPIEEALFARRRDQFSDLDIVFFDTTSIYFEGEGGETLGQHGHSKVHRPDLKQMVVGM